MTRRASTETIIKAMRIVAQDIKSHDSVASGACLEAADRLEELSRKAPPTSPWGRSDLMATAAVRYCLGRSTYIVGDCVDWLCAHWSALNQSAKLIIRRDVEEAIARDDDARARGVVGHLPLGMDMDRAEWLRAKWLWS